MTHGLDHASDETVWAFAQEHGYTLATKEYRLGQPATLKHTVLDDVARGVTPASNAFTGAALAMRTENWRELMFHTPVISWVLDVMVWIRLAMDFYI